MNPFLRIRNSQALRFVPSGEPVVVRVGLEKRLLEKILGVLPVPGQAQRGAVKGVRVREIPAPEVPGVRRRGGLAGAG